MSLQLPQQNVDVELAALSESKDRMLLKDSSIPIDYPVWEGIQNNLTVSSMLVRLNYLALQYNFQGCVQQNAFGGETKPPDIPGKVERFEGLETNLSRLVTKSGDARGIDSSNAGGLDQTEIIRWLKSQFGLTQNSRNHCKT